MKGRQIRYSADELAYIQSVSTWPRADALAAFSQRFRRDDVSLQNFNALCKRKGWMTGRTGCFEKGNAAWNKGKPFDPPGSRKTRFKKGNLLHNVKYLGHERISKDGYVEISIDETNPHTGFERRYVLKHRWLWEQANGPVPEGYALKCLSSDKTNTDPSNWEPVPRAMLPRLAGGNRYHRVVAYDDAAPELKPVVMAAAKLKYRAREIRKTPATSTPTHKGEEGQETKGGI